MSQDEVKEAGWPRAGALVVGSEILLGRTIDTNTAYIAERLLGRGIMLKRWVIVPDRMEDIIREFRRFTDDACELLIVSGGMGPTHDDITVEAAAAALSLRLVSSEGILNTLHSKWKARHPGEEMPDGSRAGIEKMSRIPEGFGVIENNVGMAEGLFGRMGEGQGIVFLLPGVPAEYRSVAENHMFEENLPGCDLGKVSLKEIIFRGRESQIAAVLREADERFPDVDIGSYPEGPMNVIIRVTGGKEEVEEAHSWIEGEMDH